MKIAFPEFAFRIKEENEKEFIFDPFRHCWLRLSPEEWVRQNFLQYLLQVHKYPASLIAIEKELMLGELVKRFDILIYNKDHQPWMMVECKAMDVELNKKVLDQLLRYNLSIPVRYLVITNGSYTFAFERDSAGLTMLNELPKH
ncbi:MAG: type I restriction enzyme HsdR N-terminal domain-containing protein [Chitinophagaceae bacterium]|nr:type I restriction enzyme HsdR N-terminal domain-containing protein [Chitinophagaceae bacterium]